MLVLEELERARGARREDLRGAARLRRVVGRVAHDRARPDRREPGARDEDGDRRRGHRADRGRLRQRARHLDSARRLGRDEGDQDRARRGARAPDADLVDEGRDGPHASAPRARSRRRSACSRCATGSCRRRSTTRRRIPTATSTTSRTRPARRPGSRSRSRTRSASAATTRRSSSAAGTSRRAIAAMTRWATFDCYGTLIDWNAGIRAELARVFGDEQADEQLARYHELEPELEHDGKLQLPRGDDRGDAAARRARRRGGAASPIAARAGSRSPRCRPRSRSCATAAGGSAILSNSDRDLIEASKQLLGVHFDETVVASEIGSYKPAHKHWREFADLHLRRPGAATSTSRRATSTTSSRRPSSASRTSGSTGSASAASRRRRASWPTSTRLPGHARRARSRGVTAGPRRRRRATGRRRRTGLRSVVCVPWPETRARIDVRVENTAAGAGRRAEAPQHLPELRLALPRRRARGGAVRLRALRPPLPDAGRARIEWLADRGQLRRGGRRRPLRRPAALLRPARRTASGSPRPS